MFLLTSSDRNHGGKVIHGIFSTWDKAWEATENIEDIDYWRIPHVCKLEVDTFYQESPPYAPAQASESEVRE